MIQHAEIELNVRVSLKCAAKYSHKQKASSNKNLNVIAG